MKRSPLPWRIVGTKDPIDILDAHGERVARVAYMGDAQAIANSATENVELRAKMIRQTEALRVAAERLDDAVSWLRLAAESAPRGSESAANFRGARNRAQNSADDARAAAVSP